MQSKGTSLNPPSSLDPEDSAVVPGVSPTPHMPEASAIADTSRPDTHEDPSDVPVPVTTRSGRTVRPAFLNNFSS